MKTLHFFSLFCAVIVSPREREKKQVNRPRDARVCIYGQGRAREFLSRPRPPEDRVEERLALERCLSMSF